jgi:hypothetical protein
MVMTRPPLALSVDDHEAGWSSKPADS